MSKKQKILVAVSAIVIVLVLIGVAVGMNLKNTNEVEETLTSSLVSQSVLEGGGSSKNDSVSIPEAPENSESTVDKSGATLFPDGENESSTSEEVTSSESTTSESSSSTSASSTSSTNSETSSSTSETSTSVSTSTPAPETSSSSSSTPSSNPSDGDFANLTQGSTGTTSFGTTYPIVSEFNTLAFNPNSTGFWGWGPVDEYSTAVGEANRALGKAVGSLESTGVAFTLDGTNNIISCGSAWVERQPSKNQYLFVYGVDFTALSDGGALSREIIKVMLGTSVTSTPIEVENALWEDMFTDNEHFSTNTWVTVGDCSIQYVGYTTNGTWEYIIKAAK